MQPISVPTPRLKFCGFTRSDDVAAAIDCGVDAVGLNFYPKSPRYIAISQAVQFSQLLEGRALRVGIFVDEPIESVVKHAEECQLDVVQLHGNEDLHYLADLLAYPTEANPAIWRAISWRGQAHPEDAQRCFDWKIAFPGITFLIDAHDPIHKGGTGKKARWDLLNPRPAEIGDAPLILAGGITAANAAEAVRQVRPHGIDLASGIESAPGIKDHGLMRSVAQAVREAYRSLS